MDEIPEPGEWNYETMWVQGERKYLLHVGVEEINAVFPELCLYSTSKGAVYLFWLFLLILAETVLTVVHSVL